jgi:F-type H+-transporting ATPase subunit beta
MLVIQWDGVPSSLFGRGEWDSWILLDIMRARCDFYPAVDPLASGSRLLDGPLLREEHGRIAQQARALLQRYPNPSQEKHTSGVEATGLADRQQSARASRLQRFLTQPLFVKESVTGRQGRHVALADTLAGVARLLDGHYDAVPEDALLSIGTLDQESEVAVAGEE